MPLVNRVARTAHRSGVASRHYQVGRMAMARHLFGLFRQNGLRPGESLEAGLGDPRLPKEVLAACFTTRELRALQDQLNPLSLTALTEDKSIFYPFCQATAIAVPLTYAVTARNGGWIAPGLPIISRDDWLRRLPQVLPATFVVKPATGVYGEAISAWTRTGDEVRDHTGKLFTLAELYDALRAHAKYDRFILQQRLENHDEIIRLTACPFLQTVRVASLLDSNGVPRLLYADWKLIVGNHVSDNFMRGRNGNLMANIALDTGVLGPARAPAANGVGYDAIPIHPVTGLLIEGNVLPCWQEVRELVLRSASLFAPLRTIGWDVAITPTGAVIVEGNRWWDPPNDAVTGPSAPGVTKHEMIAAAKLLRDAGQPTTGKR
jgi:hypothetical protein